jgi:hypothetical protein
MGPFNIDQMTAFLGKQYHRQMISRVSKNGPGFGSHGPIQQYNHRGIELLLGLDGSVGYER